MYPNIEQGYRLAAIKGLYRIARRILDIEIAPSPNKTAHTDGSKIVFDPDFIEGLSSSDFLFFAAHEYYHIIYDHVRIAKENNFERTVYNIACDVIINEHLVNKIKLKKPSGNWIFRNSPIFNGMPEECDTSKKVYKWLIDNKVEFEEQDNMGDINGEKNADDSEITEKINRADRLAEEQDLKDGKPASKEILDALERDIPEENSDWIDLLTAMRIESGRLVRREIIHNYSRPSRREEPSGIILPAARHTVAMPRVDVYIDVSGSMGNNPIHIYAGIKSILSHMSVYRPRFFSFHTDIHDLDMKKNKINLGGGTDIKKVLNKIKEDKSDLAIVITDCEDNVKKSDFSRNVVVVSNNVSMADFETRDWKKVRKNGV